MIDEEKLQNEQALNQQGTDLLAEAQALTEMRNRNASLEAQNAELLAAKKKYYDAILNGQTAEDNGPKERTRNEIRKDLFGKDGKENMSNLEYAKLVVELDDACIRETGESCFLPKGRNVTPTAEEILTAEKVHNCLADCIEKADGDAVVFNQELERRIKKK